VKSRMSLQNFKAFQHLDGLEVKPVTILCGTNSCGKSSILQSLLAIRQTLESQDPNQTLLLNGRFIHLGSFENVLFRKELDRDLVFEYEYEFRRSEFSRNRSLDRLGMRLSDILRDMQPSGTRNSTQDRMFRLKYRLSVFTSDKHSGHFLRPINVNEIDVRLQELFPTLVSADPIADTWVNFRRQSDGDYLVKWNNINVRPYLHDEPSSGELTTIVNFANFVPVTSVSDVRLPSRQSNAAFYFIRMATEFLRLIFGSYTYIGPLREEPSRRYIYEDEIVEIGKKGENAAFIYLSERDSKVDGHFFYDGTTDSFKMSSRLSLSDAVQRWLEVMDIRAFKPEAIREIIYLNMNAGTHDATRVNIADVGFGVSQVFPMILEGLRMPHGGTLLLEQPEIHLHPKLQMQIADYCISLAKSGKNVIAETHSDHVVNRLVRRVVEDTSGELAKLIGIYFIQPTKEGAKFEKVTIDETRGIVNWPVNFFDQVANEQELILRAGLAKRHNLRSKQ